MSTHKSSSESPVGHFEASYKKSAKARAALKPAAFATINVDAQLAVDTVLAAFPRIMSLRSAIEETVPTFDLSNVDKLETYAQALAFSQRLYRAASEPIESLPALVARGIELRDRLRTDAVALAKRNLLDGRKLAELKGGNGYFNVCMDVGVLVTLFRDQWDNIKGKSAVEESELAEADQVFEKITVTHAEQNQEDARATAAGDDRVRAYTLLFDAYDQVRRVISYLRWEEDDLEKFAPSLFAGRGGRGTAKQEPSGAASGSGGGTTSPAPTPDPAATGTGTGAATAPASPTTPTTPTAPTTPGHPTNSPFSNS